MRSETGISSVSSTGSPAASARDEDASESDLSLSAAVHAESNESKGIAVSNPNINKYALTRLQFI
jgi:hypothetical protein